METIAVLALALAIDLALGDPPNALHPVAWMGRLIAWLEKGGHRRSNAARFLYGAGMTLITAALFTVPAWFILAYLANLSTAAYIVAAALLLKSTFSVRGLRRAALKVKGHLEHGELDAARRATGALVSRDTRNLAAPQLASAAVESVAESTGDSLVAPLFYFLLFGVPGAIAYRAVNTLDAMIGYHGKYEHLGKFASRLDDVLNFIPARLAALWLVLAALATGGDGGNAWRTALREHRRTESPNAGWPMAAMAGALKVRLEKAGNYALGEGHAAPAPETIGAAVRLFSGATFIWALLSFIIGGMLLAATS